MFDTIMIMKRKKNTGATANSSETATTHQKQTLQQQQLPQRQPRPAKLIRLDSIKVEEDELDANTINLASLQDPTQLALDRHHQKTKLRIIEELKDCGLPSPNHVTSSNTQIDL